jgi:hypothetical protein
MSRIYDESRLEMETYQFVPSISVFGDDSESLCELARRHLVDIGALEIGNSLARRGHHCGIELRKGVGLLHSHLGGRRREDAALMGCAGMLGMGRRWRRVVMMGRGRGMVVVVVVIGVQCVVGNKDGRIVLDRRGGGRDWRWCG